MGLCSKLLAALAGWQVVALGSACTAGDDAGKPEQNDARTRSSAGASTNASTSTATSLSSGGSTSTTTATGTAAGSGGVMDGATGNTGGASSTSGGSDAGGSAGQLGSSGASGGAGNTEPEFACVKAVALGNAHRCAVTAFGALFCWGDNGEGQLGTGDTASSTAPQWVAGLDAAVRGVAAAYYSTYATLEGGGVHRWGRIVSGSTEQTYLEPTDISAQASETAEMSLGGTFACRVRTDASVNCWGSNNYGQLGNGTTETGYGPNTDTTLTDVAQVVTGYWHACARRQDGTLWCWGQNDRGQVGDGTRDDALVPTQVQGLTGAVVEVATSDERTCALLEEGSVWCWGRASWSDTLGDPTPRLVSPLDAGVRNIAVGMWHLCAVKTDDSLWCGIPAASPEDSPAVPVGPPEPIEEFATGVRQVWAGYNDTCVLRTDDTLWCWGASLTSTPEELADGC